VTRYPESGAGEPAAGKAALRREAKDWVVHMATGLVTQADMTALAEWRARSDQHEAAFNQARGLWRALGEPLENHASKATASHRSNLSRRALLGGAIAVPAAAAAGAMLVWPPYDLWPSIAELGADYHTGTGEQRNISLPGHAAVELNTRTALNIVSGTARTSRIELIAGEAVLSAGPDPLNVIASRGRVWAANSQFVVRCDPFGVRVTCVTGTVAVAYNGKTATVHLGQQVLYRAGSIQPPVTVDPLVVTAWRDGLLVFDDEQISYVIDEINRYRSGRIVLMNKALGERRISARFKIARLDAVLRQFQSAFHAKIMTLPGGLVIMS
jgi:transmembrane sensor